MQVTLRKFLRDPCRSGAFTQRHRCAAETPAGQSSAKYPRQMARNLDEQIEFRRAVLEILAATLMRFIHQLAETVAIVLFKQHEGALYPLVFADDMRRALTQERRQVTLGQFAGRNFAQRKQTERFRGGARFFASLIEETVGQLAFLARFRNDQRKPWSKGNEADISLRASKKTACPARPKTDVT